MLTRVTIPFVVGAALVLAGCGEPRAPEVTAEPGAADSELRAVPGMRPDLLVIDPPVAGPGDELTLRFPQETPRGLAFDLDRRSEGSWETTHRMTSDATGAPYRTVPVGAEGFGVDDVGVTGFGPERVRLPDELEPGEYRLCAADAAERFCAPLPVTHDGMACDSERRGSSVHDRDTDAPPSGPSPLEAAEAEVRSIFGDDVEFRETGPTSVEVARSDGAVVGRVSLEEVPGGLVVSGVTRCG